MNRNPIILTVLACIVAMAASCRRESRLTVPFAEKYEGKKVVVINYLDSTAIDSAMVVDGVAEFPDVGAGSVKEPVFTALTIDGRIRGYYVLEPGKPAQTDSTGVVRGTPLNDLLAGVLSRLDSVDNLDDMEKYVAFVEEAYGANKGNAVGDYLGVEWLKFANPDKVDAMLAESRPGFRDAPRVRHYVNQARQRAATSPGRKYVDFSGETASGAPRSLSSFVEPGKYTLVDFWASWCPYCIKELPDLESLRADYHDKGLEIVGVAVRDTPDDTREMVRKKNISWPVLYNTQRVPYDIYGFSGIPHHLLIGPDGVIVSRGENVEQLRKRLEKLL